jgi:hypothetical protein
MAQVQYELIEVTQFVLGRGSIRLVLIKNAGKNDFTAEFSDQTTHGKTISKNIDSKIADLLISKVGQLPQEFGKFKSDPLCLRKNIWQIKLNGIKKQFCTTIKVNKPLSDFVLAVQMILNQP